MIILGISNSTINIVKIKFISVYSHISNLTLAVFKLKEH